MSDHALPPSAAFVTMTPLLLKHLASSLSRQVAQMNRLNLAFTSPVTSAFRCICILTTAPRTLLSSSPRISSIQAPSFDSSAHCGPSLLGRCQHLPSLQPVAGMKTKSALKKRCKDCFFVIRRGHLFVFCKTNPRHKQRQG